MTRRPTVSALPTIAIAARLFMARRSGKALGVAGYVACAALHRDSVEHTPLVLGMNADEATQALGTELKYLSGRPGDEIFLTFRNIGGSGLFVHKDRLYLQFRQGRLAGWKGDWGHNWMWQSSRCATKVEP